MPVQHRCDATSCPARADYRAETRYATREPKSNGKGEWRALWLCETHAQQALRSDDPPRRLVALDHTVMARRFAEQQADDTGRQEALL